MTRYSIVRADHIEYALSLIFSGKGDVRLTRGQPSLSRDERAVALTVRLPKALFATPTLRAEINVEAPDGAPLDINLSAISEAVRGAVGMDVDIRVTSDSDRSREASETALAGSTEGESAGRSDSEGIAQDQAHD